MPLGIKAVVSAIYEPPQEGTRDGVKLEPAQPETEAELAALASNLGLQRVGWMFTDLIPSSDGQVKHFRNIDTYFLSSQVGTVGNSASHTTPFLWPLANSFFYIARYTFSPK